MVYELQPIKLSPALVEVRGANYEAGWGLPPPVLIF